MTGPPTKKGFIEQVSELLKDHPIVAALTLLVGAFGLGFGAARAVVEFSGNEVVTKTEIEKFKILGKDNQKLTEKNEKLTEKNEKLTTENQRLKQCEGQISGMSAVSQPPSGGHHLLGNRIVMGNITPCREKRLWLVVSPISLDEARNSIVYDKDCYVQGEIIPPVNEKTDKRKLEFQTATTSITEAKSYKIYFLAVDDEATNNLLIQAQGKNPPHILCSLANLHKNQVAMETFDNK
ncbi:MAG: hypothetical protein EWV50_16090 [Microcystis aeruginosa Ma_MB_F_20061100_S20]|uniref:Uncharacterized protein n=1 Tax=Microcystis aeruginosa Ma_MB_F_20061100_S20D TaxID=2486253 RepID=A0A552EWS4_MICAE|nr:MAG: hypothetical protein EWV50_16090 [Microcystis aeruginosa Ma_MB_F_20061100_S20]TRU38922.1 MAG: hypothetical protein EWV78_04005 [Microcystis aeruginosa Ma_MB_F_20061100_S20D]